MPKKVCLVDGSGYIFRAFYALPPMTNPAGVPVNAVYGFTNMFLTYGSNDLPLGPTGSNMDSRQLLWSRIHLEI